MSPDQTLSQSLRDYPPPPRAESPIQLLQGWYYVIVGLSVCIALGTFQSPISPVSDLSQMWFVRVLGSLFAIAGVGLIWASRQRESIPVAIGGPFTMALLACVAEVIALANDVLPTTFLLDAAMQFGFLLWWSVAIYKGESLVRSNSVLSNK
jgi:hypothetical protein